MTIQKFLNLIYTKNPLKPALDKGKKKIKIVNTLSTSFLIFAANQVYYPLLKIGISV